MKTGHAFAWTARTALLLLLLGGCASTPSAPPKPIASISQIEGKWRGTISMFSGPEAFYFLTVHPDGKLVGQYGMNWQWGQVTLQGGAATFEMQGIASGTMTYYEQPRTLVLNAQFGNWSAQLTPLQ
jgi:hypothetical protein